MPPFVNQSDGCDCSILPPLCSAEFCVSFRADLGCPHSIDPPQPDVATPSFCAHGWLSAYELQSTFSAQFCNSLPDWLFSQLSACRNKSLFPFIKAPSAWSLWETPWRVRECSWILERSGCDWSCDLPHAGYFDFSFVLMPFPSPPPALSLSLSLFRSLFRAAPAAFGGSQARGWMWAAATGLHHRHSSAGSEPWLWPTPQLAAAPGP